MLEPTQWACAAANELHAKAFQIGLAPPPVLLGKEHVLFADIPHAAEALILRLTDASLIDRDRTIYLFELDDQANIEAVINAAIEAKKFCTHRLPQINASPSKTLYVGSSYATGSRRGTLRTRLQQHLLGTSPNTYSMALSAWASELAGGISISAWQYAQGENPEQTRESVLAIEDWLARKRQPILGRRGIRN